jgi:hypothetical protein
MPVDIYTCLKCGGFEFVQLMQIHVRPAPGSPPQLVEQVATARFQCVHCKDIVTLDE